MGKMKSLVYMGKQQIEIVTRDCPTLTSQDEVIIKIKLTGICGTDLNILKGKFQAQIGTILGHESVGTIVEVGNNVQNVHIGDRVVIDPTLWCGECEFCKDGRFNFCDNKKWKEVGVDYDGAFAEYIKIPKQFVYQIPDYLSWEAATLIEPLACVLNNFNAGNIHFNDNVLILGGGPIGAIAGVLAQKVANNSLIVDTSDYRVSYLKQMGLNAIKHKIQNIAEASALIKYELKAMPSVIIDTTGCLCNEAADIVSKGGVIVLMGFNGEYNININLLKIVNRGVKIIGAGDYNLEMQNAINLADKLNLERLISHILPMEEHDVGMEMLLDAGRDIGGMKILLNPNLHNA